jgi:hypothetical protein
MVGAAGGHQDYGGNEVNVLALNAQAPAWQTACPPTPNDQILNGSTTATLGGARRARFNLDLKPSAMHTYFSTQFIDSRDRMLIMSGIPYNGPATAATPSDWPYIGTKEVPSFNIASGTWDAPEYIAAYPGVGDYTASLCAKHQLTEEVYVAWNNTSWWKWKPATNTWVNLGGPSLGGYAGCAIDPFRQRMLIVGSYGGTLPPSVRDLGTNSVATSFGGLGAGVLTVGGYPGVIYDEVLDAFHVMINGETSVALYTVDASTWDVSAPVTTGPLPAARPNGIQNAFQYVPELRGIVIANSYEGNVYFMRTAA